MSDYDAGEKRNHTGQIMFRRKLIFTFYRAYSPSIFRSAILTQTVPALGESITEGSVAKWVKNLGDKVEIDDVVAIVETDKVTVDIKSTYKGTLAERMVEESGTVVVGAPIFKIDSVGSSLPNTPVALETPKSQVISSSSITDLKTNSPVHHRIPLIKFKGKRNLIHESFVTTLPFPLVLAVPTTNNLESKPHISINEGKGVNFWELKGGAWYGRPTLSEIEISAIESGGASLFNPPEKKVAKSSK